MHLDLIGWNFDVSVSKENRMDRCPRPSSPLSLDYVTLSQGHHPLLKFPFWLLVLTVYRFYAGSAGRSARGRIPGKSYRGRYGSRADRFVSWSGQGRSAIDIARIFQAWFSVNPSPLYQAGNRKGKGGHAREFSRCACFLSLVDGAAGLPYGLEVWWQKLPQQAGKRCRRSSESRGSRPNGRWRRA